MKNSELIKKHLTKWDLEKIHPITEDEYKEMKKAKKEKKKNRCKQKRLFENMSVQPDLVREQSVKLFNHQVGSNPTTLTSKKRKDKIMRVITLTRSNDKELFVSVDVFKDVFSALVFWNGEMLMNDGDFIKLKEGKKALEEDGLFFTYVDGFDRKWAFILQFKETK